MNDNADNTEPGPAPLASLLPTLRDLPGLAEAVRDGEASLVVPTNAQAGVIAAAVEARGGPPTVVAVPLASEAQRLAGDLEQFLPAGSVALFPAWETLPFERVSPAVETMGSASRPCGGCARRTRRSGSWWPRQGPWCSGSARMWRTPNRW